MGATIYFADEAGVRSDYHAGTTWAPVGRTPVVAATGDRFGVNLISAVTGLALAATAYSRALGQRLMQAGDAPVEGGTTPSEATPEDLAGVQRQLTVLQWLIPGLTGAALVLNALMGEQ